jgi:hypothetical protein
MVTKEPASRPPSTWLRRDLLGVDAGRERLAGLDREDALAERPGLVRRQRAELAKALVVVAAAGDHDAARAAGLLAL